MEDRSSFNPKAWPLQTACRYSKRAEIDSSQHVLKKIEFGRIHIGRRAAKFYGKLGLKRDLERVLALLLHNAGLQKPTHTLGTETHFSHRDDHVSVAHLESSSPCLRLSPTLARR